MLFRGILALLDFQIAYHSTSRKLYEGNLVVGWSCIDLGCKAVYRDNCCVLGFGYRFLSVLIQSVCTQSCVSLCMLLLLWPFQQCAGATTVIVSGDFFGCSPLIMGRGHYWHKMGKWNFYETKLSKHCTSNVGIRFVMCLSSYWS